jgi:sugar/nucleoside kinase (ribokinase family)
LVIAMTARLLQMSGVIVDMIYQINAVPQPGTEAEVRSASIAAGGGFNAMVAAHRAGLPVAYGGTLGTGPLADLVDHALAAEGITQLRNRLPGHDQGCCTVLVDAQGERTFIAASGADGIASNADLACVIPQPQDWILLSGYALVYPGSRVAMADWVARQDPAPRLVFDPSPKVSEIPAAILAAVMRQALWISANAAEAACLTAQADPAVAARLLAASRAPGGGAIVRVGAAGCWLVQRGQEPRHLPGHPVLAIDTNGAGDAHIGHFIAALARGETPTEAAIFANVAAALSTTSEGPSTAPTRDQVLAEMSQGPQPVIQQRR